MPTPPHDRQDVPTTREPDPLGPFLCEWCGTPLATLRGTAKYSDKQDEVRGLGLCPTCHVETWSRPVKVLAPTPAAEGESRR